jgi:4-amino-4-deoxy-L-arabinose transferase-like glycosyltransferase
MKKIFLILILLVALFLRFYKLEAFPVGYHIDEISFGYNAWSLMETGADEYGVEFPLHLKAFGDYRPALYAYFLIPFFKIFGIKDYVVRYPSALFGALLVLPMYFCALFIFKREKVALAASFLAAISPWGIIVSRASSETIISLFFFLVGLAVSLLAVDRKKTSLFLISFFSWFLSLLFYHAARLFVPIFLILFFGLLWQKIKPRERLVCGIFYLLLIILPLAMIFTSFQGKARLEAVSVFHYPEVRLVLDEQIREEGGLASPLVTRFFHNKPLNYGLKILENYGNLLNINFLFLKGGLPIRYLVPNSGLFYLVELPLLLIGIFLLIKVPRNSFAKRLVFGWLLIGFLPAAMTSLETPNIQRSIFALPPILCLIAYAIGKSFDFFKKRYSPKMVYLAISLLVLGYAYFFLSFLHQYFIHLKVNKPWYRMYEMKELVQKVTAIEGDYEKVVVTKNTTAPYIYFLFYNKIEPEYFQKTGGGLEPKETWEFDQHLFNGQDCPLLEEKNPSEDRLYVERSLCDLAPWIKVIDEIRRSDGSVALRLEEFDRSQFRPYLEIEKQ